MEISPQLLQKKLQNPEVQNQINWVVKKAERMYVTVHHAAKQITQVLSKAKQVAKHTW